MLPSGKFQEVCLCPKYLGFKKINTLNEFLTVTLKIVVTNLKYVILDEECIQKSNNQQNAKTKDQKHRDSNL